MGCHRRHGGVSRIPYLTQLLLLGSLSSLIHSVYTLNDLSESQESSQSHHLVKRQVDNRRVVCYYANWAVYRQGTAKFSPQNINPYLCTHLIYAFAGLGKDDKIQTFDKYQDLEKGGYGQFAALKTYNRDLKTLIAIGGWNEGSRKFSPLVADPQRRKTFIKSAIRFLRQYNFDGLDLDWEYPTFRDGGKPEDRANYAKFVVEMRQAFESEAAQTGKPRLMITMAVPASLEYAGKGFDIKTLDKHLDFFNLLTYDYHSAYEPATNHHSPLYRPRDWSDFDFRADLNIDTTIQFFIKSGASRDKLVLGIPTYGRSYTLVNPDAHEIGSPTDGPGAAGKGTKEDGYLAYYEICQAVEEEDGWEVETPYPGVMGPYAHRDKLWVGFDDEGIVREKAHFVNEESLGGIMFWTIDNDDFRSACGPRPFPLIEAAKEALYGKDAAIKTATSVSISTSETARVERLRLTRKQLAALASQDKSSSSITPRPNSKTTPFNFDPQPFDPFSTPEPPTTPSSAPAYECKDEGFFPHTKSCKKYFWCLDVPGSGMVAHTFTCPQGLYFNSLTDGCDFRRNVDCEGKDDTEEDAESTEGTTSRTTSASTKSGDEPETLEDVLAQIKAAGGLDAFEENLRREEEEREAAKRREEERRAEISKKTRSRLSELLDRKRAEVLQELERNGVTETEPPTFIGLEEEDGPVTLRPNRFRPQAGIRNRLRNRLHEVLEEEEDDDDEKPSNSPRNQNAARPNIASIRQRNPALSTATTTERPTTESLIPNRGIPPIRREEDSTTTPKPLEYVTIDRGGGSTNEDNPFVTPLPQQEITSEEPLAAEQEEEEERPRAAAGGGLRGSVRDLEYVTIQRGNRPSSADDEASSNRFGGGSRTRGNINQPPLAEDEFELEDPVTRATSRLPSTTPSPNIRASLLFLTNPSLSEEDLEDEPEEPRNVPQRPPSIPTSTFRSPTPSAPVVTTFRPAVTPTSNPGLDAFNSLTAVPTENLRPEEELFNNIFQTQFDAAEVTRPRTDPLLSRRPSPPRRPEVPRTIQRRPQTPRRLEPVPVKQLPVRPNLPRDPVRLSANRARQPLNSVTPARVDPFSRVTTESSSPLPVVSLPQTPAPALATRPQAPIRGTPVPVTRPQIPIRGTASPVTRAQVIPERAPVQSVRRPSAPIKVTPAPAPVTKVSPDGEYIYEYEYVYEDDYDSSPSLVENIGDYDLNPLTSKVEILDNGKPVCHDTGVFPHPGSCRKFITCSIRATGTGIVGWVYECPSYLAFDPVGGRCNWANELVCAERRI